MKGYRTMALGLGFAILGSALLFAPGDYADVGVTLITTGLTMAGMRAITDGPVGG